MDIINQWIDEYTSEMLSWTLHKIPNEETAKDIIQDTFFAVAKNIGKFKGDSKAKTWIFSILKNKISDYYRKKYREPQKTNIENPSRFFTPDGEWKSESRPNDWQEDEKNLLDNEEFRKILNWCIENLPGQWSALIRMKYLHERKADKICQELDISTTNMWQITHRAKLELRSCVEKNWFKR